MCNERLGHSRSLLSAPYWCYWRVILLRAAPSSLTYSGIHADRALLLSRQAEEEGGQAEMADITPLASVRAERSQGHRQLWQAVKCSPAVRPGGDLDDSSELIAPLISLASSPMPWNTCYCHRLKQSPNRTSCHRGSQLSSLLLIFTSQGHSSKILFFWISHWSERAIVTIIKSRNIIIKKTDRWGAWLAQSLECVTQSQVCESVSLPLSISHE